MFFTASKLLSFLFSPINWIAAAFLVAVFSRQRRRRRALIAAIALFFVFTNGFVVNRCLGWLEPETIGRADIARPYEIGIVLGGMIGNNSGPDQVSFNQNGDRLFQTIELYQTGKIKKILISSGSGLLLHPEMREAVILRRYLERIGIPSQDILVEAMSRNTHENAVECSNLLTMLYGDPVKPEFLLITSASHLRRATACFKKQGLNVVPYSTTKRAAPARRVWHYEMILPDPDALWQWKVFFHEVIGLAVYRVKGYV